MAATATKTTKRKHPNTLKREDGELNDEGRVHDGDNQSDAHMANPANPPWATRAPRPLPTWQTDINQTTHRGLLPLKPTQSCIAYMKATYPRVVKFLDSLLTEIMEATANTVRANPDKYIALLMYGGGNNVKEENPNFTNNIKNFLLGLTITGNERICIVDPPKRDTDKRGEFAKPHILLPHHGSPKLQVYLLWYQSFTFQIKGRKIAFSALWFDANIRPWL
ncbi:hypothetical protein BDN71DRAFT_1508030 [Pleurotus eryngii]|uniref:Uncharacterized protein n=1 Tax=Pleurotus eryngii TaxID=5323 RepID=A0A9P6D5X5_PLEER|nr:hypothetical protein BDN71DRAFT_1508030 [Pleurotus eryngii]